MRSNSLRNFQFDFVSGTQYFIEASTREDLTAKEVKYTNSLLQLIHVILILCK